MKRTIGNLELQSQFGNFIALERLHLEKADPTEECLDFKKSMNQQHLRCIYSVLSVSLYVSLSVVPVIQYRKNIGKWPFRVREGILKCLLQSMNFFYIYNIYQLGHFIFISFQQDLEG